VCGVTQKRYESTAQGRNETYLRNNLSYERWNARDFVFTYVLDHNVKRIPTSADEEWLNNLP
jgi:hypothetical protein